MNSFLYRLAGTFYNNCGADIRKYTFVFPNRRAGLFFQKYLGEIIEAPVFSPEIITVNECFFNASDRLPADRTAELFRIYRLYRDISKTEEDFDSFVFWGEMLLGDFDEVDKHLIDATNFFRNITHIREIDNTFEALSEEQRKAIEHFWAHTIPQSEDKKSSTQKSFIAIWEVLADLYTRSREELRSENRATEGMIFREVAEQLRDGNPDSYFEGKSFVFVGFNALNPSETALFKSLQKAGQADFYWDYEVGVLRDKENKASKFYEENIREFPSKLNIGTGEAGIDNKEIELISIPSSVGQTKEIHRLLDQLYSENPDEKELIKTAVVLPDESLLVPLLHSLPEKISNINVTMGFPLKATPVTSLLENIFELQRRTSSAGKFYHITVSNILNHQYISKINSEQVRHFTKKMIENNSIYVEEEFFEGDELFSMIFTLQKEPVKFIPYLLNLLKELNIRWQQFARVSETARLEADFIFQYYTAINRMQEVMKNSGVPAMSLDTLVRLIRRLVGGVTIPFEGEPLNGLQVMGMLETRGLDFENLIIASFNEGVFPKRQSANSFIPFNLRRAFGLPTDEQHDAISSYNFYRLIQRTRKIYFLYDSRSEGMQTGEVSRYIYQLQYHYRIDFKRINLTYDVNLPENGKIEVAKTGEVRDKLFQFVSGAKEQRSLSPSSINTYINCPLSFYFSYVERLREQDEVTEGIEAAMFGTLLHHVMENLYKEYEGRELSRDQLESMAKNRVLIEKAITQAFAAEFFKKDPESDETIELEGSYKLYANILYDYIVGIIRKDAENAPFTHIKSEQDIKIDYPIEGRKIKLGGKVDRVDRKAGKTVIIDYKTGGDELSFKSMEQLFEKEADKRPRAVMQTFLYSELYMQQAGEQSESMHITPQVFRVREVFSDKFSTMLYDAEEKAEVDDYAPYRQEFNEHLTETLNEIFDENTPFTQVENDKLCSWCPYLTICRREAKEGW